MKPSPGLLKILSFVLSLASCITAYPQQQGEISYRDERALPAGVEGERVLAILGALNSNDPKEVESFIMEHCTGAFRDIIPLEEHVNIFRSFYWTTGGVEFHSIRHYTPARAETVVIVKDKNFGSWRGISLYWEGADKRIAGVNLSPARRPTDVEPEVIPPARLAPELESLLARLCERDIFSGAVLLAKGDEVLFAKACGEASKRFHAANNLETKFNLGSMNKMFTAVAVMQLVEKGKVPLDAPISSYVDESWLPESVTGKVTVRHLLTHTSGLGSYFNETYQNSSRELFRKVDDYKPLVQGDTLAFEPGSRFRYSNTGMLLLGVVIEKATGQDYFDYIRENIYKPAGMANTDCYEMDFPVENLAIGYIPAPHSPYKWENNLYKHVIRGGPAGGGFSTVGDLHRFARALQTGKLLSKASLEKLWTDYAGASYGYGFSIETGPKGRVVGHSGGFPGLNGNLDIFLENGYITVVLSNYDNGASPLAGRIRQMIESIQEP